MTAKPRKPSKSNSGISEENERSSSPRFFTNHVRLQTFRVAIVVVLVVIGAAASIGGISFLFNRTARGDFLQEDFPPSLSSTPSIFEKKVLVVLGEGEGGVGEKLVSGLVDRGASVSVIRQEEEASSGVSKWEGTTEIRGDLGTVVGQEKLAQELEKPESLSTVIFTQHLSSQPPSRIDNGEGLEKGLAFGYVSRRIILEGLVERGFKGRVFSMGWVGNNYEIDDFNGDFAYERSAQLKNWIEANNALVLAFRRRHPLLQIYGANLPFHEVLALMGGGSSVKGVVSLLSPLFSKSLDDYVETMISVMFCQKIPSSIVFVNQYGEGIAPSPYLSDKQNVEFVWKETNKLLEKAKSGGEEDWWKQVEN